MKILIAEDDAPTRLALRMALQKLGHEVTPTENGRLALDAWRKSYFPVLISDWMMPEMDGPTLCRAIRVSKTDHYTTVILLTALGSKQNYIEGMQAGADDFITKPFDTEQLNARLLVAERIANLQQHVLRLEGLLSVCSYCKRINDKTANDWKSLERYVSERSEARFSHGVCPQCMKNVVEPQLAKLGGE